MTRTGILHVAPEGSVGIHQYAKRLVTAVRECGIECDLCARGGRDGRHAHFHLGNSTRVLYGDIMRATRPSVVSLHDVIPRTPALRPILIPFQVRLLGPHVVIVHSRFAEDLLRQQGFRGECHVAHLAGEVSIPERAVIDDLRMELSPDGRPILVMAGILNAQKSVPELVRAAMQHPEFTFVFAGRAADKETRAALARSAENVRAIGTETGIRDHSTFTAYLACADMLLNFRGGSVGESSGPVVEAHALGTPVAGFAVGALPEYCGPQDRLFDADVDIAEAIRALADDPHFERIPSDSPVNTGWAQTSGTMLGIYKDLGWL